MTETTLTQATAAVVTEAKTALDHCAATAGRIAIQDQAALLVRLIGIRNRIAAATGRKTRHLPPLPEGADNFARDLFEHKAPGT